MGLQLNFMRYLKILAIANLILFSFLSAGFCAQESKYKLQPLDVINITVHGQPDLSTKTRIASDGTITFPLVGIVKAGGLTTQELENNLKAALEKKYLVNAQVLVFIEEYRLRQISVVGEVNKPGKYDMPPERDLTLLEGIAMAEGFTKDAHTKGIKINRVKDGKETTIRVNANDIMAKGKKDVILEPNDIIVVPESFF